MYPGIGTTEAATGAGITVQWGSGFAISRFIIAGMDDIVLPTSTSCSGPDVYTEWVTALLPATVLVTYDEALFAYHTFSVILPFRFSGPSSSLCFVVVFTVRSDIFLARLMRGGRRRIPLLP